MFTGIVQGKGTVVSFKGGKQGGCLRVSCCFSLKGIKIGESIAVDGCCLTVVSIKVGARCVDFDVSDETMRKTTMCSYQKGTVVNLERAMKVDDRFGGHLVLGHVDGIGKIKRITKNKGSLEMVISYPRRLARYLIEKGSVTIDGISMTVCQLKMNNFTIFVIPHTAQVTNLGCKKEGHFINLELDVLGKYVERLISCRKK